MRITIDIPDYDNNSIDVIWDKNGEYNLFIGQKEIYLSANREALISFAKQFLYLATNDIDAGTHIHFDSFFTNGTRRDYDFVIEKL